jgi:hypothetical protein
MSKDLVIIGAYPTTDYVSQLLKESISSLTNHFDIALSTHYPVDKETQSLVKYYVYDYRNELVNSDIWFWVDTSTFYSEITIFGTDTNVLHHGFAVFRSIMNAINITKADYDNFYYIEGDCIFDEKDIIKLKEIKTKTIESGKKALFFGTYESLSSLIFYCDMEFFIKNVKFCKNTDEYNIRSSEIGSYGIFEHFLYKNIEANNRIDDLLMIDNGTINSYLPNSKLSLHSIHTSDLTTSIYRCNVVRVENSDDIALVYINNNESDETKNIDVFIDEEYAFTLPWGKYTIYHIIHPKNENFGIKTNHAQAEFSKNKIYNSKSFLRVKNM